MAKNETATPLRVDLYIRVSGHIRLQRAVSERLAALFYARRGNLTSEFPLSHKADAGGSLSEEGPTTTSGIRKKFGV